MTVRCFMLHATDRAWRSLRRYHRDDSIPCPGPGGYHNAHSPTWIASGFIRDAEGCWRHPDHAKEMPPQDDPRWPTKCEHCAYVFQPDDEWQVFDDHVYVTDEGTEHSLRAAPPGAMWFADYMGEWARGPDGHALNVVCPNGSHWLIDGPANNCTMPSDRGSFETAHRCWVRHGTPPNITVDKAGHTCGAGAGSIQAGNYHGFLRNGHFTNA